MSDDEYSDVEDAQPVRKLGEKGSFKKKQPKKTSTDSEPKKKGGLAAKLPKIEKGYVRAPIQSNPIHQSNPIQSAPLARTPNDSRIERLRR